jgi:putative transposase
LNPTTPTNSEREPALDALALAALVKTRNFSTEKVELLFHLKEMIRLSMGLVLGQWRESRDPVSGAFAEHCQAELKLTQVCKVNEILTGRFARMPPSQRKRYSPEERFQIVLFVRTYGLSFQQAADSFLVDPQTIARWVHEATREPDKTTVGSLLKATPPLRSFDDVTRTLVADLDTMGVGGSKTIAQMLRRAGVKIGRETVRGYRKARTALRPTPAPPDKGKKTLSLAVRAREPNHIWTTDITNVPSLFNLWIFKLVVVLDLYSRFPLAFKVFAKEPRSEEIAALVQTAAGRYGKPKHFVTDQGPQFTGQAFTDKLRELGTKQRFGAIGQSGSIAVIERLWRTLKETLDLRFRPPLCQRHLEDRVALGLEFYATLRPHQGLRGATPAEIYFGLTPVSQLAVSPPRATSRDPASRSALPYALAYADPQKRHPFLIPNRRAA